MTALQVYVMDGKENLLRTARGKRAWKSRYTVPELSKISPFHRYDIKLLRNHSHCTYYPSLLDLKGLIQYKGFISHRNAALALTHMIKWAVSHTNHRPSSTNFLLTTAMSFRSSWMPSINKILQNFQFLELSTCQIAKWSFQHRYTDTLSKAWYLYKQLWSIN